MAAKILRISVKPASRESRLEASDDGAWRAWLKSPPVEGRANTELISLVAAHFGVRKSSVSIEGGATGRLKKVRIADG